VFLRALLAFLALPGLVAFVVPWFVFAPHTPPGGVRPTGVAVLAVGTFILGWCVRDFYVLGRGTLAPWEPPRVLVVRGLYRYSRNPMYVGVLCIVAGWGLGFQSIALIAYAVALGVLFHLRIVLSEEPFLARTHGVQWEQYAARVPRWLGWWRRSPVGRNAG
jgi:protein-S-isoprenylcysteine O-methyltransferase Ste14